jgi:hypothetical protein
MTKSVPNVARAYDLTARELFGDFAKTNFPREAGEESVTLVDGSDCVGSSMTHRGTPSSLHPGLNPSPREVS